MKRLLTLVCLISSTLSAFSQEWVRQHPFAGFAPLHDITFDDNGNGWAVGQQSLILHTDNWGEVWNIQKGLPIGHTLDAVAIVPGTNAQIVLAGGPGLFITRDGENWSRLNEAPSVDAIFRVQAFDAMNWAAYGWSRGVRTTDGGENWTEFDMPDSGTSAAWFNDQNNGWASKGPFEEYKLYKTTNGGMTWEMADDAIYPVITDIIMLDSQTGFLSGRDYIFKTTNGGADWTQLHNDVQPSLTGMCVVNENIIWSGLNNGSVFYTLNGGQDWTQMNPNIIGSNQVFGIHARADGRVWVPGKYASVQYSMDFGQHWEDQTPGNKSALFDVRFDGNIGFAVGSEGAVLTTTNGGAIWNDAVFNADDTYLGMALYKGGGDTHLYLGATSGAVLHSSLSNPQWESIGEGLGQIFALHAINTQVIVAGTSFRIMRTTNGGANWTQVATTNNYIGEFAFPSEQTGYVAVQDGSILKTVDGGATWNPVLERDNTYRFTGLHFQDNMLGWAVAEFKDSVFTTNNGGVTWTSYKLPSNTYWQDIQFMNADTGYISGGSAGSGNIMRTTDGGVTWKIVYYESERLNRMYVRPNEDYVWVVGYGGNILHFSPCAVAPEISDLTGLQNPCVGDIVAYEVNSSDATVFTWTVPNGWTIIGNDNSARVDVLVGAGGGVITIQASNTCGTETDLLSITVSPMNGGDVSIAETTGTLSTTLNNVTYQWLRDNVEIPGATNSSYTPSASGSYTLVVTFPNGCTATSNAIQVTISGVRDTRINALQMYPNPAGDFIAFTGDFDTTSVTVYDQNGRAVMTVSTGLQRMDVHSLSTGIYFVQLKTAEEVYVGRFVKR